VFWYTLTENLRRLDALKELVAEGSRELSVQGYREIGVIRTAHHERRARRGIPFPLSILPRWVALVVARPRDTHSPREHMDRAYHRGDRHGLTQPANRALAINLTRKLQIPR
jgi:hypothetical protein